MRVLLTGHTGFLGSLIYAQQVKKNQIICLSRKRKNAINHIRCDLSASKLDLENYSKIDRVIHCAGKAHSIPFTEKEKLEFYKINTQGTINLLNSLDAYSIKPKSFVFISTVAVYGLSKGEHIDENANLSATEPYGHSKILAEQAIEGWGKKNDVCITILRLPLLVGDNALGNLGAMVKGIQKGNYVSIGKGNAKKSMVLASDIAASIDQIACLGGTYNLTDGYHPNFRELEIAVAKKMGKRKPLVVSYRLAKLIAYGGSIINALFKSKKIPLDTLTLEKIVNPLTFSDNKAREAFNWKPNRVLDFYK